MVDNDTLKKKLADELKRLKLSDRQQEIMVRELNYLANLLIDVYVKGVKNGK